MGAASIKPRKQMNWNSPYAAFHSTVMSDPDFFVRERERGLLPLSFSHQPEGGYHSHSSDIEFKLRLLSKFIAARLHRIETGDSNIMLSDPFIL